MPRTIFPVLHWLRPFWVLCPVPWIMRPSGVANGHSLYTQCCMSWTSVPSPLLAWLSQCHYLYAHITTILIFKVQFSSLQSLMIQTVVVSLHMFCSLFLGIFSGSILDFVSLYCGLKSPSQRLRWMFEGILLFISHILWTTAILFWCSRS